MSASTPVQLCVERCGADRLLIRVAGELDQVGGARLLRLLEGMLHPSGRRDRPRYPPEIVVLDLGEVRAFDRGGLAALRHAGHSVCATGAVLQVTGLAERGAPLPRRVAEVLDDLRSAATPEAVRSG